MLETLDLACLRGDRRLFRGLNLAVAPGQLLRVEGANGAGKTSLLRLLAGLALPAAGAVHWAGQPIQRQREAYAQALLYLGHLGGLKDELTAAENLQIEADLSGMPGVDGARIAAALDQIDARLARLALLRSYLAPLAAGDFRVLDADADCRFLMDILSAAPVGQEATA